ncbi:MAG: hypothetical protein LJF04_12425, partial [Gemmatimonadetes bacterium]|nr:hypothetical protein [Gemmatimonadota bacterium]
MLDRLSSLLGVPRAAAIVIGVIAVVQIVLQVYSLMDLARRSAVKGGRKWIWALVIVLGQIL